MLKCRFSMELKERIEGTDLSSSKSSYFNEILGSIFQFMKVSTFMDTIAKYEHSLLSIFFRYSPFLYLELYDIDIKLLMQKLDISILMKSTENLSYNSNIDLKQKSELTITLLDHIKSRNATLIPYRSNINLIFDRFNFDLLNNNNLIYFYIEFLSELCYNNLELSSLELETFKKIVKAFYHPDQFGKQNEMRGIILEYREKRPQFYEQIMRIIMDLENKNIHHQIWSKLTRPLPVYDQEILTMFLFRTLEFKSNITSNHLEILYNSNPSKLIAQYEKLMLKHCNDIDNMKNLIDFVVNQRNNGFNGWKDVLTIKTFKNLLFQINKREKRNKFKKLFKHDFDI